MLIPEMLCSLEVDYISAILLMPDKVYMVNHFTRRNGSEDSKATAICAIGEAKEMGKLLMEIK